MSLATISTVVVVLLLVAGLWVESDLTRIGL
jgi:hypothetical protein